VTCCQTCSFAAQHERENGAKNLIEKFYRQKTLLEMVMHSEHAKKKFYITVQKLSYQLNDKLFPI
jgi:hypothetical protein